MNFDLTHLTARQAQIAKFYAEEQLREQRARNRAECEMSGHIYAYDDYSVPHACVRCGEQDPYDDDIPF